MQTPPTRLSIQEAFRVAEVLGKAPPLGLETDIDPEALATLLEVSVGQLQWEVYRLRQVAASASPQKTVSITSVAPVIFGLMVVMAIAAFTALHRSGKTAPELTPQPTPVAQAAQAKQQSAPAYGGLTRRMISETPPPGFHINASSFYNVIETNNAEMVYSKSAEELRAELKRDIAVIIDQLYRLDQQDKEKKNPSPFINALGHRVAPVPGFVHISLNKALLYVPMVPDVAHEREMLLAQQSEAIDKLVESEVDRVVRMQNTALEASSPKSLSAPPGYRITFISNESKIVEGAPVAIGPISQKKIQASLERTFWHLIRHYGIGTKEQTVSQAACVVTTPNGDHIGFNLQLAEADSHKVKALVKTKAAEAAKTFEAARRQPERGIATPVFQVGTSFGLIRMVPNDGLLDGSPRNQGGIRLATSTPSKSVHLFCTKVPVRMDSAVALLSRSRTLGAALKEAEILSPLLG